MLQSQGYHDFRKIKVERDENEIEVEARDKSGRRRAGNRFVHGQGY